MRQNRRLFTSESVTEGHPDKICDQISDAILDAILEQDPASRVACEVAITTGLVVVMGEITTRAYVDIQRIVRETIRSVGYDKAEYGFDCDTCGVMIALDEQSEDIRIGVDASLESRLEGDDGDTGAGDQGMMFGYACDDTPEYMPYPISLAHRLSRRLTQVRKEGILAYLRPDGKTQVSVEYDGENHPVRIHTVVLSSQHDPGISQEQIFTDIKKHVFDVILPEDMVDGETRFLVNPTGQFVIGGPHGDTGLPAERLSWIPMEAMQDMGEELFPVRTIQRWTVPPPMQPGMRQSTWWRRDLQSAVNCSFPMPSE